MIIGGCPYDDCNAPLMTPIATAGMVERHECKHCQRTIWTYHSRIDPWSMTDDDFRQEWDVNEEEKTTRKRGAA